MSTADPDPSTITSLPLSTGLSRGTVVVSLIFGILSTIMVSCRIVVRVRDRMYGWDDTLLLIGLVGVLAFFSQYCPFPYIACLQVSSSFHRTFYLTVFFS